MRRFAFRLDRVARVREIERDRARGEYAAARAREAAVTDQLDRARSAAQAEAVGLVAGRPTDLRAVAFRAGLRAQAVGAAQADLVVAAEATATAGRTLQDAARRVDALDRLRDTQREVWAVDVRREEAKVTDDVATTRAARVRPGDPRRARSGPASSHDELGPGRVPRGVGR